MGFFSNIVSGAIKTALTPVAIVKDAIDVTTGGDANNTKELLNEAKNDVVDAADSLVEGDI